jgi:hypothetical protein
MCGLLSLWAEYPPGQPTTVKTLLVGFPTPA